MFRILQPRTTNAVLAAMRALDFGKHESVIAPYRATAARLVRNQSERTALTLATTRNPSAVALLAILGELGDDIVSGNHHVYRGLLGVGGVFLTPAFAEIVRQLRECNALSEEEAAQAMQNLYNGIRAAG